MSQWLSRGSSRDNFIELSDGRRIWVPRGAEGEGDPPPDETPDGDPQQDPPPAEPAKTFTAEEFAQLQTRMQAADRAKTEAEKKVKAFEDEKRTDLEKAQNDAAEAQRTNDALNAALETERMNNALLTDTTYSWQNPATVLKLIDRDAIKIGDDGSVNGFKEALKKLADENPFLLKSVPEGDGDGKTKTPPASGDAKDGKPAGDKAGADKAALAQRYPALRSRL